MATKEKMTEKEALELVKQSGYNLRDVPYNLRTEKVCKAALSHGYHENVVLNTPAEFLSMEIVLKAAPTYGSETKDYFEGVSLDVGISVTALTKLVKKGIIPNMSKVQPEILNEVQTAVYDYAIQKDINNIRLVPEEFVEKILTKRQALRAVEHEVSTGFLRGWDYVGVELYNQLPEKFQKDPEVIQLLQDAIVKKLMNKTNVQLSKLDESVVTDQMYELQLAQWSSNLDYIPQERITKNMCKIAVDKDGSSLKYVPQQWKEDFYVDAVKNGGLSKVPEEDRTDRLCTLAVENKPEEIQYVPDNNKTYAICLAAIDQKPELIEFVPLKNLDEEMMIRLLISLFKGNCNHEYVLFELTSRHEREGKTKPVIEEAFDNFFEHPTDSSKRRAEVSSIMHKVLAREPKLYSSFAQASGVYDHEDGFSRRHSGPWKKFFGSTIAIEHAVTAAQADITVVSQFQPEYHQRVWKEFIKNM